MEDIPGCNVAPGLPMPRQPIKWSNLCLGEDLSSLHWVLLMACAKDPQTLKNTKKSESAFRAASTGEDI